MDSCMQWCMCPKWMFASSFLFVVYSMACVWYLAETRRKATPFLDSLTEDQKGKKAASSRKRKEIFVRGLAFGAGVSMILHGSKLGKGKAR